MRIYVIGPVTGREDRNRPAFEQAARTLERSGYDVCVPHWFIPDSAEWGIAMRRSIEMLVKCDGVACLPDFGKSKGARIEADLACALGMPVKMVETWERLSA